MGGVFDKLRDDVLRLFDSLCGAPERREYAVTQLTDIVVNFIAQFHKCILLPYACTKVHVCMFIRITIISFRYVRRG